MSTNAFASVILNCDFKMMNWGGLGELYTCDVMVPTINRSTTIGSIERNHKEEKSNDEVAAFRNNHNEWNFIPDGIAGRFLNIQTFQIMSSNLAEISK